MKNFDLYSLFQQQRKRKPRAIKEKVLTEEQKLVNQIITIMVQREGTQQYKFDTIQELLKNTDKNIINITATLAKYKKYNIAGYSLTHLPKLFTFFVENNYPINYQWTNKNKMSLLNIMISSYNLKISHELQNLVIEQCKETIGRSTTMNTNSISITLSKRHFDLANKLKKNLNQHWASDIKDTANEILMNAIQEYDVEMIEFFEKEPYPFINDNLSNLKRLYDTSKTSFLDHLSKDERQYYTYEYKNKEVDFIPYVLQFLKKSDFDFENYFNSQGYERKRWNLSRQNGYSLNDFVILNNIYNITNETISDKYLLLVECLHKKNLNFDQLSELNMVDIQYNGLNILDIVMHYYNNNNSYSNANNFKNYMDFMHDAIIHKNYSTKTQIKYYQDRLQTPLYHRDYKELQQKIDDGQSITLENYGRAFMFEFINNMVNLSNEKLKKDPNYNWDYEFAIFQKIAIKAIEESEDISDIQHSIMNALQKYYLNKKHLDSNTTIMLGKAYDKNMLLNASNYIFMLKRMPDSDLKFILPKTVQSLEQKDSIIRLLSYSWDAQEDFVFKEKEEFSKEIFFKEFTSDDCKKLLDATWSNQKQSSYSKQNIQILEELYMKKIKEDKETLFTSLNPGVKPVTKRL